MELMKARSLRWVSFISAWAQSSPITRSNEAPRSIITSIFNRTKHQKVPFRGALFVNFWILKILTLAMCQAKLLYRSTITKRNLICARGLQFLFWKQRYANQDIPYSSSPYPVNELNLHFCLTSASFQVFSNILLLFKINQFKLAKKEKVHY